MNITTVGIDLAKDVITAHARDKTGHCVLSRNFKFKELAEWLVQLPEGCVIGMEACSTAHYWGRRMQTISLSPRLMAAEFVPSLPRMPASAMRMTSRTDGSSPRGSGSHPGSIPAGARPS